MPAKLSDLQFISSKTYAPEVEHVQMLKDYISFTDLEASQIRGRAMEYANIVKTQTAKNGVESFIQQYSLSTEEGVAIMCLAESLLRIPDKQTANELIEDKLSGKNWKQHLGKSKSLFVNASSWGLLLTGKVVDFAESDNFLAKMVNKLGEPVVLEGIKKAIKFMSDEFILGENLQEALKNGKNSIEKGYNLSFDILGESSRTAKQAEFYYNEYLKAVAVIAQLNQNRGSIYEQLNLSVKLSALHPKVYLRKIDTLKMELLPRLEAIVELCEKHNISLSFDAEESFRQDVYLEILESVILNPRFGNYHGIGFVVQGYSKRAFYIIDFIAKLAQESNKRIPMRLVKGAYWDSEVKHSQEHGLEGYPVFTMKEHTDLSYIACAKKLFSYSKYIFPQFATHNAITAAIIIELAGTNDFEFQRLQGMGQALHDHLLSCGFRSRIYAPVGKYEDLLAYLMRRLLENGANTSFVHLIADDSKPLNELVELPTVAVGEIATNPKVMLPQDVYANRVNSQGLELGIRTNLERAEHELSRFDGKHYHAHSIVGGKHLKGQSHEITNPANHNDVIGTNHLIGSKDLELALKRARSSFASWSKRPVLARAEALRKFANLMEENRFELCSLMIREAGKNIDDALNEVREAVDFARYYANCALELSAPIKLPSYTGESSELSWHPRGVFVCVSPWNFPLAIFCGQILAALVTGNTVIAKPADMTTIIATRAVELMLEAGVDEDAISLVLTTGQELSDFVISSPDVRGVCFTGSTKVAQIINRNLAARDSAIATLIAETGGQNAMIVDSSALLEQAADAIVNSAFGSMGQRCSALRVLYAQKEIVEPLMELVEGATAQLKIGNTRNLDVDLGPIITKQARANLLQHAEEIVTHKGCKLMFAHPHSQDLEANNKASFMGPKAIKINSMKDLNKENFGPILHVVSYQADELDRVIDEINSTGFGLTTGIQTRIEDKIYHLASRINAGNFYANRSIIGAQVQTHPFGGENNSGTGFKAGGPHYLMRFMTERTRTINTTAIGGNIELLA